MTAMKDIKCLSIASVPSGTECSSIIDSALNSKFIALHDFSNSRTFLISESDQIKKALSNLGISTHEEEPSALQPASKRFVALIVYLFETQTKQYYRDQRSNESCLEGIYQALNGTESSLFIAFSPSDLKHATGIKAGIEKDISDMDVRVTRSIAIKGISQNSSSQADVYYGSDRKRALLSMLNMVNDIIMSNGCSYKISVIIEDAAGAEKTVQYIKSKLLVLDELSITADGIEELYKAVDRINGIPFSNERCAKLLFFSDKVKKPPKINTAFSSSKGDIIVGNYVHNGIRATETPLFINKETLNLGAIVSGLPGSGKTASAKSIIGQLTDNKDTKIIIISPNDEWNNFGYSNGLEVIKIYDSNTQINFFRCNDKINVERFYEDLSMLVASASNAGPYRNSIEKVLLSAFNKSYKNGKDPDPNVVYSNIELAVIEQHAKVTNVSVKYTKHGENIKAALQNLRLIISRPEFAYNNGIDFSFIIDKGAVFDLSKVSNNMKPFFYALILNQVYGFAESFDIYGDDKLRMLICLEEAQVVFNNDISSAANQDLENRIQNFRKKGVGLFLLTHNATDISPRIRRLLQFKMYFRQSSDVAKYAANDLIFTGDSEDDAIDKLKVLGQRNCAVNYISIEGGRKIPESSIFVEIPDVEEPDIMPEEVHVPRSNKLSETTFTMRNKDGVISGANVQLMYLGEKISEGTTDMEGRISFNDMLIGKEYRLVLLGEKKKDSKRFHVWGGKAEELVI